MLSPTKKAFSRPKNSRSTKKSPRHSNDDHNQTSQDSQNIVFHTNEDLKSFMELIIPSTTTKLNVQHNFLTDFKGFPSLRNLEELDCSNNKIETLYRFPVLPNLKEIKIADNPFSCTEFYRMSLLIVCSSLQKIDEEDVTISERFQARELYFKYYDLLVLGWILNYPLPTDDQINDIKKELKKQHHKKNSLKAKNKAIKEYIESQLNEINEKLTLQQIKNILKFFSIVDENINEDNESINEENFVSENLID